MNRIRDRESGRRWFGAAVVAIVLFALVAVPGRPSPAAAAYPGVNGKLAWDDDGAIWIGEPDGRNMTKLAVPTGWILGQPEWSPDGGQLAVTCSHPIETDDQQEICTLNSDGSNLVRLTEFSGWDWSPSWSPDGQRIAFHHWLPDSNGSRLYVMNSNGTGLALVMEPVAPNALYSSPSWSPDGKKFVFSQGYTDGAGLHDFQIFVMNIDGSDLTQLTWSTDESWDPEWSPDGTKIVFRRDYAIFIMNSDGTDQTRISNLDYDTDYFHEFHFDPTWSPDGHRIAFDVLSEDGYGPATIHVMNADGSGEYEIGRGEFPSWQRLPYRIGICPASDPHVASAFTTLFGSGMRGTATPVSKALSLPNAANLTALYAQYAGKDFGLLPSQVIFKTAKETITQTAPTSAAYRFGAINWYGAPLKIPVSSAKVSVWDQFLKPAERTPRAFLLYATHRKPAAYYDVSTQLADSRTNHVYWETDKGWIAGQQVVIDIPTLTEARDIILQAAVVDNDRDTRLFKLTASAGGVSKTVSAAAPNKGAMLNLVTIKLVDVPAGTDQIVLDLVSPSANGDSVALVGYTLHYACEE